MSCYIRLNLLILIPLQSSQGNAVDAGEDEKESSFGNDGYAEVGEDEVAEELAHLEGVEDEEVEPLPIIEVQHPANLPCP